MEERFKSSFRKPDSSRPAGERHAQSMIPAELAAVWLDDFLAGAPQLDQVEVARLGHLLQRMGH